MKNNAPKPFFKKKPEENRLFAQFVRLFGKYDIRNERQFGILCKWILFITLIIVESLIVVEHLGNFEARGGWRMFIAIIVVGGLLSLSEALKLFVVKEGRGRAVFYVLDALAACAFMLIAGGLYPVIIYMLVLTEFYIFAKRARTSIVLLCVSVSVYAASYAVQTYVLLELGGSWSRDVVQLAGAIAALLGHFLIAHIALAFYHQYLKLDKAMTELDESKRALEKAYQRVAEVTALEERQRIAKDIHDTAGHSLTTVIMQTEAAKLIVEKNPSEAKTKIVAANLQAKHALEELRDSVHLLSGISQHATLKEELEQVIHESTDGTGIKIRSAIEDITLLSAKRRFLVNALKEGISNGLRHGGATAFWFELKAEDGMVEFVLSDNGKGFSEGKLQMGFGLTAMTERAKALGGEIAFASETDEGVEIKLRLPLDK